MVQRSKKPESLPSPDVDQGGLRLYKAMAVTALTPYDQNARTHSPEQVEQIAASIREFGFTNPVLVDEQARVIAGHGRVLAAMLLGLESVPTLCIDGLSDAQRRALILADNKLALNAGWDAGLLRSELEALQAESFDLGLLGWSEQELKDLFLDEPPADADPDAAPSVPEVPHCVDGDVWILGAHRLAVGDCLRPDLYQELLGTERVDAIWTDPPYNVAYSTKAGKIANDDLSDGDFRQFLVDAFALMFAVLKPGGACYVAHADTERVNFTAAFSGVGFKLSGVLIWAKDSLVLGRSDYQWMHEPILYGWRPGSKHKWNGGRKNTTVQQLGEGSGFEQQADGSWAFRSGDRLFVVEGGAKAMELVPTLINEPKPKRNGEHPTMKPVALIERLLKNSARVGDLVLDPFGGSGSTLIAADRLGMSARLIELDPGYADVIIRRWQNYTGRRAVHAVSRLEFPDAPQVPATT